MFEGHTDGTMQPQRQRQRQSKGTWGREGERGRVSKRVGVTDVRVERNAAGCPMRGTTHSRMRKKVGLGATLGAICHFSFLAVLTAWTGGRDELLDRDLREEGGRDSFVERGWGKKANDTQVWNMLCESLHIASDSPSSMCQRSASLLHRVESRDDRGRLHKEGDGEREKETMNTRSRRNRKGKSKEKEKEEEENERKFE